MSNKAVKHSEIRLRIGLNEENLPVTLEWEAEGQPGGKHLQPCKALLISIFDGSTKETLRIDLWTQDTQVMEMDRMMYQTIRGLGDSYFKATNNRDMAIALQQFAQYFGERTEIIPPLPKPE